MNKYTKIYWFTFVVVAIISPCLGSVPEPGKYNVLFIVADDLNCNIGPYRDAVAVTPNLDRLAARGFTFERAYCQQSVCNPSRSSFLTGLRPDTIGVDDLKKYFRNTAPDGKTLVTLPQHFKNHGYFCQDIGKLFHNTGDAQDRQSWSVDEAFFKGTHADDTVFANDPRFPAAVKPYKAPITENLPVPATAYRDGQIANLAAATLRDYDDENQPLFLAVGFWRPHMPFVAPKRYWDLYDSRKIPMPDPAVPPKNVPEAAMHASYEIHGYGEVPKDRDFTEEEIRNYRHGYYASISFMDDQLGKILDALDESDLADNTIIVFTSDHGLHIGERTLWGKTSNFELDTRVPLIISAPGFKKWRGQKTNALAELVDLYPTLAELAGINQGLPSNLEGVSLVPSMSIPSVAVKHVAYSQHPHPFYRQPWTSMGYTLRTDQFRYTEWHSPDSSTIVGRELYDHYKDSLETVNRVDQAGYEEIVGRLSLLLRKSFRLNP